MRVLDLATFDTLRQFRITDNAIFMLRLQATAQHNMLAVADSRAGVKVYDLRQPTADSYASLYQVQVHVPSFSACVVMYELISVICSGVCECIFAMLLVVYECALAM